MENKISFNELVNLNKKNMNKYNEYMSYIKSVFRTTLKNIDQVDVFKKDDTIVLEIQYIENDERHYFNIIKSNDYDTITINGKTNDEISLKVLNKCWYIFEDLENFCNNNTFMENKNITTLDNEEKININIFPGIIILNYTYGNKSFSVSYDGTNSKTKVYNQKIMCGSNTYNLYAKKNIELLEIIGVLKQNKINVNIDKVQDNSNCNFKKLEKTNK